MKLFFNVFLAAAVNVSALRVARADADDSHLSSDDNSDSSLEGIASMAGSMLDRYNVQVDPNFDGSGKQSLVHDWDKFPQAWVSTRKRLIPENILEIPFTWFHL